MLSIVETKDFSAYTELLAGLSLPEDFHLTEVQEDDTVRGYIIYAYEPEQVVIYALQDGHDLNYCDGLVRSVLFKAELRGIERAAFRITDSAMLERLKMLRFIQNDENILQRIADVMENCKNCRDNPANT
ncbi:MAG: hypothetical protein IKN55_13145 [Oscillospiraceae bacterium]|nr:hypothetical protein [Oscillospiraceae bacterium]